VVLPKVALTGSDVCHVTGNDMTGSDVITGSMFCGCSTGTFCTTTRVVVQNVVE